MSMIERVARAIEDAMHNKDFLSYEDAARASIEAMREPTDAMKVAGGLAVEQAAFEQGKIVFEAAGDAFQAMISAALSEEG